MASRIARICRRRHRPLKVEVHADDPDRPVADQQLGHHRAARLERRQVERGDVDHARHAFFTSRALPCQPRLRVSSLSSRSACLPPGKFSSMPRVADPERAPACRGRDRRSARAAPPTPRPPKRLSASCSATTSASISWSTCEHPLRPPPPVGPDRLAHIVAGDGDGGRWSSLRQPAAACAGSSNVQVRDGEGILLDEFAAGFDDVAHQAGEDFVGDVGLRRLRPGAASGWRGRAWFPTIARRSFRPGPCSAGSTGRGGRRRAPRRAVRTGG